MLECAIAIVINLSKEAITPNDELAMTAAAKGCQERYKDAPCLKKFIKVEPLVYRVVCGK